MPVDQAKAIAVELQAGEPVALEWNGRRFEVTDTPTQLADLLYAVTHPPAVSGWRFQGTDSHGQTHVFDVIHRGECWVLARVYD